MLFQKAAALAIPSRGGNVGFRPRVSPAGARERNNLLRQVRSSKMRFTSKLMKGAGVLALSTGFAAAAPALVQNDLNLRAGPGVEFPVVAAMPAGTTVNVMGCQASWCQVAFGGTAGWANRAFLGLGGGAVAGAVAVAPRYGTYESYRYGGYAPAYGYDEGTYVSGGYGPGYTYGSYGTPAY